MTSVHELTLLRLVALRIAGPGCASALEAVRRLTALQAQDHPGALTSVALRTAARDRGAVEAALTAGEVVKSWPMRGTLHLVAAEDLNWMLALTSPRQVAGQARRSAQLEIDDATVERARQVAVDALTGGRELTRAGLTAVWQAAGLEPVGQRAYHLILHLAQTGTLCFGPIRESGQQLVLLDEWVPRPRVLERDEALGELALRYFRGHGPATVKDFGRWAKLVAADVRAGLAAARPELVAIEVDGVEYLMDPRTPDELDRCRASARGVFLLPGFDEYMLGYGDRSAALPVEFADRIVPGGNGVFVSTVVADGQVVGTWRRTGKSTVSSARTVEVSPFEPLPTTLDTAIRKAQAALP